MTSFEFLSRVAERTGVAQTGPVVRAVLQSLGELLTRRQADALADELPPSLGPWLQDVEHAQPLERFDLVSRVAQRACLPRGEALEWMFAVGRTVGEAVRDDVLKPLRRDLPADVAELLVAVEPQHPVQGAHHDPSRHTLAEGRELHPLYAARPDNAQSQSVARTDNPHGDTKLSSSTGISQERESRTLASSRK